VIHVFAADNKADPLRIAKAKVSFATYNTNRKDGEEASSCPL